MENLGIDYKLIIAQLVNFAILFFIFKKFLSAPFLKFIQEEKRKTEEKDKLLAQVSEQSKNIEDQKKLMRDEQKRETEKVLQEAKKQADAIKQAAVSEAENAAREIVEKAKAQLADERSQLQKEMRQKMASLSTMLVEKGLRSYLSEPMQKEVTQRILSELPDSSATYEN